MRFYFTTLLCLGYSILLGQTKQLPTTILGGNNQFGNNNVQNNYGDPNQLPDSINCIIGYDSALNSVFIAPRKGTWEQPFIALQQNCFINNQFPANGKGPSFFMECGGGFFQGNKGGRLAFLYKGVQCSTYTIISHMGCTNRSPYCFPDVNKYCFFVFGDYTDRNKWYYCDYGNVGWLNSSKNIVRK